MFLLNGLKWENVYSIGTNLQYKMFLLNQYHIPIKRAEKYIFTIQNVPIKF